MADASKLKPIILKFEGGFVNNPNDHGGATNSGVTIATFRSIYGNDKTVTDLKKMTSEQWLFIFKKKFWDKWKADEIKNQSIANLVVDWYWASGVYGIKYPQAVLGLTTDGIVGPKTISTINNANSKELFEKLWNRRKKHFTDIVAKNPSQKVYLKGWLNRLNAFKYSD